jgi:hypothetical protein
VLGPHARLALEGDRPRTHAEPCEECSARSRCVGVDAAYLARFTAEELRAIDTPPTTSPLPPRLARMFVGPGTLVAMPMAAHEAPATVRRRLPLLGRPNAATAEVRGRVESREARVLFPDLYDDES